MIEGHICSYPPCDQPAVTTFPADFGVGYLCDEHAERFGVVESRLATWSQEQIYAYIDGLIDAQQGLTTAAKDALRDQLRTKYAKP